MYLLQESRLTCHDAHEIIETTLSRSDNSTILDVARTDDEVMVMHDGFVYTECQVHEKHQSKSCIRPRTLFKITGKDKDKKTWTEEFWFTPDAKEQLEGKPHLVVQLYLLDPS